VDYAAENQGFLYVLCVPLASSFLLAAAGQAVRLRFYGFALAGKIIKSSTTILHAVTLQYLYVFYKL
jgi:hypothetical protein